MSEHEEMTRGQLWMWLLQCISPLQVDIATLRNCRDCALRPPETRRLRLNTENAMEEEEEEEEEEEFY